MSKHNHLKQLAFTIARAGFRLMPMPVATRDRLRQRFLADHAGWIPSAPKGRPPIGTDALRPLKQSGGPAIGYTPHIAGNVPTTPPATLVAFYLPQYHPIPENDAWWGTGFTEWRNVAHALPQFEGHEQPRQPADLGYYDLRLPSVMKNQMQLAREYGIGAFCSYFYWFGGKTLLEQPLKQWLDDPTLDLPICLCWANENWSRRWDGRANDVLIGQQHGASDDLAFIEHVSRYLRDPRYLRVQGKPMLLVYRPGLLPEPRATATRWREWCRQAGIGEIHLAYVQSFDRVDPRDIGFDAAVEFPPNNATPASIAKDQQLINPGFHGEVLDWRTLAHASMHQSDPGYPLYPGVNPGWDNEPRRSGRGRVLLHASPRRYRDWLAKSIAIARHRDATAPLVFINAWNEWAEGAVLEPDTRLGHAWLAATRAALRVANDEAPTNDSRPCAVVHVWYVEVLDELMAALGTSRIDWRIILTTAPEHEAKVRAYIAQSNVVAEIEVFENRGRDVLPFLRVADRLLNENVPLVLKLHTKRSTHRDDGARWRSDMVAKLTAGDRATHIVDAFAHRPELGLVAPEDHVLQLDSFWGANKANADRLAIRLGLPNGTLDRTYGFIAGSMFWARLESLRPLLDAHLGLWEFEAESGQTDGTLAHAIERIIGPSAASAGYVIDDAAAVCGLRPTAAPDANYPYAKPSG
jgi:lipopolysaccharide biosynthesis protein